MIFESFETISRGEIGAHATDWSRIASLQILSSHTLA